MNRQKVLSLTEIQPSQQGQYPVMTATGAIMMEQLHWEEKAIESRIKRMIIRRIIGTLDQRIIDLLTTNQ